VSQATSAHADCYRKVIEFIREHPDDYDPGYEDGFAKLVDRLDPPAAMLALREGATPASITNPSSRPGSPSTCGRRVRRTRFLP
jgi:hypothetical protein